MKALISESSAASSERDDEPEMMPVFVAALREGLVIDIVAFAAERPGLFTVLGHAVAAEIRKMRGKRCTLHAVTHHP